MVSCRCDAPSVKRLSQCSGITICLVTISRLDKQNSGSKRFHRTQHIPPSTLNEARDSLGIFLPAGESLPDSERRLLHIVHGSSAGEQRSEIDRFAEAGEPARFEAFGERDERVMQPATGMHPLERSLDVATGASASVEAQPHWIVGSQPFVTAGDQEIAEVPVVAKRNMAEGLSAIDHGEAKFRPYANFVSVASGAS